MLLGVLQRMIIPGELVKLLCQRQGQRKRVPPFPPHLIIIQFSPTYSSHSLVSLRDDEGKGFKVGH